MPSCSISALMLRPTATKAMAWVRCWYTSRSAVTRSGMTRCQVGGALLDPEAPRRVQPPVGEDDLRGQIQQPLLQLHETRREAGVPAVRVVLALLGLKSTARCSTS